MRTRTVVVLCGLITLLVAPAAAAQQTQKRSEVELMPVGPPPEERPLRPWDPYTISLLLELGGQFTDVNGNNDVYRAHQNYRDGFRVFDFDFRGKGQDAAFFSDFYARGSGWVNEPYSWVRFGFSKENWFDFRGVFRQSEYDWLFPGFARNQHVDHTERRWQTYDLTLFPNRAFRGKLGYSRNSTFGPTFTSVDFSRDEFLQFEPVRRTYDEYHIGAEASIQRWFFAGEFGYRFFRHDRFFTLTGSPNPGNDTGDSTFLNFYERDYPTRGKIPFARFNLAGRPHETLEVNARLVYSRAKTNFTRTEAHDGQTYQGVLVTEDIDSFGNIVRPMTTVNGNLTWRPWRQFTITNNFQYRGFDIAGFQDEGIVRVCGVIPLGCNPGIFDEFENTLFDLNTFQNRTEGRYDFTHWFGVRAGFNYRHRDFRFFEFEDGTLEHGEEFGFLNRSFLLGFMLRPNKRANFFFDLERGNNTRVFTRLSPANIDRIRLRGRFEPWEGVRVNASWFIFDNSNFELPTPADPDGGHSARNRGFSVDFQLTRSQRGYLNLGYSRNDVTTVTDDILPAFGPPRGGISTYILNSNYAYIDFGGRITGNLYADAGYRVAFDTGTFPASDQIDPCSPFDLTSCNSIGGLSPFGINFGGLDYHQPHVALRYLFSDNLSWKAGWRWYGYNQKGGTFSDYKAHIVTTSLVLRF